MSRFKGWKSPHPGRAVVLQVSRRMLIVAAVGVAVQLVIAAVAWPRLPEGEIWMNSKDGGYWAGRTEVVLSMPILVGGLTLVMTGLFWLFEKGDKLEGKFSRLPLAWAGMTVLFTFFQVLDIRSALG